MKLTTGILAVAMMTGAAWAQNPDAIDNTRSTVHTLQQIQANQSNAALEASEGTAKPAQSVQTAKPAPGAPAPAVKPAAIPGAKASAKPATSVAAKPAVAAKSIVAPSLSQNNKLEHVKILHDADDVQIQIASREAVTPKVSKLSSPARVVVELPSTVMATAQNKIAFGSAGVKGVRIGTDGKTPPTTSVVVDLEQAMAYELTPGPGNEFVLTLHTNTVAKNSVSSTPVKASAAAPKVQAVAGKPMVVASPAAPKVEKEKVASTAKGTTPKTVDVAANAKAAGPKLTAKPGAQGPTKIAAVEKTVDGITKVEAPKPPKAEEKKWAMTGRRDPFFSPVVQQTSGSGCSTGKKCLEIGQINVRGVVKSEAGFIAVVTNSLNKAYFLHENDPVFNGYVLRITGDSVVFQENMQDKLGKPLTREVVKRITTPAV